MSTPSQQHMYMEPQAALALPDEGGAILVHSSTQCIDMVQTAVAAALGLPYNKVIARALLAASDQRELVLQLTLLRCVIAPGRPHMTVALERMCVHTVLVVKRAKAWLNRLNPTLTASHASIRVQAWQAAASGGMEACSTTLHGMWVCFAAWCMR